jgi:hypothetical protein
MTTRGNLAKFFLTSARTVYDELQKTVRSNQRIFVLEIDDYAYVVPYVTNGDVIFLKTLFPSRKHTAEYLE